MTSLGATPEALEPVEPEIDHFDNPPAPDAPMAEWIDWANGTAQLRGLGMVCTAIEEASAEFAVESVPYVPNPNGSVNGGMLAAIADNAMGFLATMKSPPGYLSATASLHIQFHRPAKAPLTVSAHLMPGGKRVRYVHVEIRDRDGNHCTSSQGTMITGAGGRPPSEDKSAGET